MILRISLQEFVQVDCLSNGFAVISAVVLGKCCLSLAVAQKSGIGQALTDHTVSRARNAGFSRIRLYTSTDPNEAAAQLLYEKNGFKEIRRKKGMFTTTIFREKTLNDAVQPVAADGADRRR